MPSDQVSWADAIGKAFNWVGKAFRVVVYGFDGADYNPIAIDSNGNVGVAPALTATTAAETTASIGTGAAATVLAANADRKRAWIQNTGTGFVRLKLGSGATTSSAIRLVPEVGTYVIEPSDAGDIYVGIVTGIAESGTNALVVVEED